MRAAAARIEGVTFESLLTRAVFESLLVGKTVGLPCYMAACSVIRMHLHVYYCSPTICRVSRICAAQEYL